MARKHARPPWAGRTPPAPARPTGHSSGQGPTALGIDIGRVIISPGDSGGDTSFLGGSDDEAMKTPPSRNAFETIAALVEALRGRVWLVSKCGPRVQARTRKWLAHWRFYERTGVPFEQVRFCRERRDKAPICQQLGLSAFIDDRPDVLAPMAGIVPWRYLYGPQRRPIPADVIPVRDWDEVRERLLSSASGSALTAAVEGSARAPHP
ncbi:hypothetical protein [Paraliomyxa miuraensis]|uniref:hypothetical protein n=1 Tax=Paraliomyxa miuraensis TaxID=376150 RepID=UPI002252B825|nr:hypothetical protein [Paraliomyxa miuraensis]MCX4243303.1 hypothetical protein [Paraliomyxa miuraensis]